MVNIVDTLADNQLITPSIVDRHHATIAIGTEGAVSDLAYAIKRGLGDRLPATLGTPASIGKSFWRMADRDGAHGLEVIDRGGLEKSTHIPSAMRYPTRCAC